MRKVLILSFIIVTSFTVYSQEWQLKKAQDHVRVYLEDTDNSVKAVKAEMTVTDTSIYALVNLLRDIDKVTSWMDSIEEVRLLQQEAEDTDIVATVLDVPWPFTDRIMVTRSRICIAGNTLIIQVNDALDVQIDNTEYIRMTEVTGRWQITQLARDQTHITYQGRGDPSGAIPNWLARSKLVHSTFKTFLQLKQKIVATKYQGKPLGYELMNGSSACTLQDPQK
ncbi:MAG: START domain-containing protein [Aestuariibacter sp.]